MKEKVVVFLFMLISSLIQIYSQDFKIKGRVVDENFNSLVGVMVSNTKLHKHITTNIKGEFEITANICDSLKFEFVGLTPEIIIVNSKREINLIMIDKSVNCLGAIWSERDYKRAYRKISKKHKRLYKKADKLRIWNS